jgi:V/A-type H+-transporting ATPase subunit F
MPEGQKIVAIGPRAEMLGLRSIGVDLIEVESREEMVKALDEQGDQPEVRLILLSETVAEDAREEVQEARQEGGPAILLVPSHRGSKGTTIDWMRHAMEQSIGVDVISD